MTTLTTVTTWRVAYALPDSSSWIEQRGGTRAMSLRAPPFQQGVITLADARSVCAPALRECSPALRECCPNRAGGAHAHDLTVLYLYEQ